MMRSLLATICLMVAFLTPATAQQSLLQSRAALPILTVTSVANGFLAQHIDGSRTLTSLGEDGQLSLSVADSDPDAVDDTSQLVTKWTDAQNVEHTVSTPVPSTTPAGMQRAIENHQTLVEAMQAIYPPKPV